MQTAALLQKPMHLGEGFDLEDWWSSGGDTVDTIFSVDQPADANIVVNSYFDFAVVDNSGTVSTQSGQTLITANTLSQIATNNPGREAQAVAQSLQVTNPDWPKQFKNTDELVRAAAGLFSPVKAVVTGQPIPRNTQSPYVYGPGQAPMQQTGLTTTHMLLIGGAALAAILLLRRK
jgi:hypothetical protein